MPLKRMAAWRKNSSGKRKWRGSVAKIESSEKWRGGHQA